ncbi:hypothetical protein ELH21_09380 [Rhizobium leguminosarum]|uniref:hypothetical protein n=1 Tax=Rhizobium leguminosarum TaxID=384 RepID=UPI001031046F|nr:hypothetical protein [Rhizobium leguminosarum]TBD04590.1 hypothetical protein ELH21_09380 [Rhizobium leguminosarum]
MANDAALPEGASPKSSWPVVGVLALAALASIAAHAFLRWRAAPRDGYGPDENKILDATFAISTTVSIFGVFGILAALISAYGLSNSTHSFPALFGMDVLVSAAAAAIGGVLGFLFGIPRTLDPAARAAVAGAAAQGGTADKTNAMLATNTNLERVSDWLTTMLIGATLVQLGPIVHWLRRVMDYLSAPGANSNAAVLILLTVYFLGLGFLGVYLITRLYLTSALTQTLGILTGASGGVSSLAAVRSMLSNMLNNEDPAILGFAVSTFENWKLTDGERSDPQLNQHLVRLLAKYTSTNKSDDQTRRLTQASEAFKRAIVDPSVRASLKSDLQSNRLSTGDKPTDEALLKMVN